MAAEKGKKVHIHYKGTLDDGTVFDSSEGKEALTFILGESKVIPGFEEAILGMKVGEEKDIHIASDKAYGPRREELVQEVPKTALGDLEPKEGMVLAMQVQGVPQSFPGTVIKVGKETVTIDINPPLAGKDLNFHIKLEKIE